MVLQSWTESSKMKQQTHPAPLPPKKIMDDTAQKPKCTIFAILVCRRGDKHFPSIAYKHRRQPGGILNINYSLLKTGR